MKDWLVNKFTEGYLIAAMALPVAVSTVRRKVSKYRAVFNNVFAGARAHEGASYGRSTRYWFPSRQAPDQENAYDIPTLRERSRDLYRNNTIGRGAIKTMVTNVIGRGLDLQAKIDIDVLGLSEESATAWETRVEKLWRMYEKECHAARQFTFKQLQKLAFNSKLQSGEVFTVLPIIERGDSIFNLRVKLIEADLVASPVQGYKPDVADGIEYDENGQPTNYTIYDWEGNSHEIPAFGENSGRRNVLHLFTADRPGQHRGVPFLSPVIETIKQLGDYRKSEQTAAVVQSLFTAFIKSNRSGALDSPYTANNRYAEAVNDAQKTDYDYIMAPGAINRLDDDEDITFANPTRPNSAFESFITSILREIGMALEIPLEILSKQFLASYSASRGAKVEFFKTVLSERNDFIDHFCQPIYEEWLYEMVLSGRVIAPGFLTDPEKRAAWCRASWIGESMGQIDEVKEVRAAQMRIESGFSTHAAETAYLTGGDFEQNIRKLKRERDLIGFTAAPSGATLEGGTDQGEL